MRERGARQERVHARQAALPLQGLRAELHRHAAARPAAAGQGHGHPAPPEWPVDEPHRQAAGCLDPQRDDLDRAVRRSLRPETRAGGPGRGGRARRDVALSQKKTDKLWVWKARDRASGRVVDWECGGRDAATLSRLLARVERWKPRLYCTDDWAAYAELIPQGRLFVGKEETHGIERDHARQRHWLPPLPPPPRAAPRAPPLPPPHLRRVQDQADGGRLDRAVRPLRRRQRDPRTLVYAGLKPCNYLVVSIISIVEEGFRSLVREYIECLEDGVQEYGKLRKE